MAKKAKSQAATIDAPITVSRLQDILDEPGHALADLKEIARAALKAMGEGNLDLAILYVWDVAHGEGALEQFEMVLPQIKDAAKLRHGKKAWQIKRENEKRKAADKYAAFKSANLEMKEATILARAVEGTKVSARTLRRYLSRSGQV